MWHFVHVVGPDFWPARFFSLWHLVHNLFITYFFFRVPSAFSFWMLPGSCGNTEWHTLQSPIRSWCWRCGKGTLPFVPAFISMFSAPLFWVSMELTTPAPASMVKIDTAIATSLNFILTGPGNSDLSEGRARLHSIDTNSIETLTGYSRKAKR